MTGRHADHSTFTREAYLIFSPQTNFSPFMEKMMRGVVDLRKLHLILIARRRFCQKNLDRIHLFQWGRHFVAWMR